MVTKADLDARGRQGVGQDKRYPVGLKERYRDLILAALVLPPKERRLLDGETPLKGRPWRVYARELDINRNTALAWWGEFQRDPEFDQERAARVQDVLDHAADLVPGALDVLNDIMHDRAIVEVGENAGEMVIRAGDRVAAARALLGAVEMIRKGGTDDGDAPRNPTEATPQRAAELAKQMFGAVTPVAPEGKPNGDADGVHPDPQRSEPDR